MKLIFKIVFLLFSLLFYGQNDTLAIIKHTDKDIIVNKNSKIVYRGLQNSLFIEVPNCKSFTASGNGLTLVSKNEYNLNPIGGSETEIILNITLKNNKKIIEKHLFKIKNISSVISMIQNLRGDEIRLQKVKFKDAIISVEAIDKNLDLKLEVLSFEVTMGNIRNIKVFGNKIKNEFFHIINSNISKNDTVIISNIQVKTHSSFSGCIRPDPIKIKVL